MTAPLSISHALKTGWNTTKSHFGTLIGIQILVFAISIIPSVLAEVISHSSTLLGFLINISSFLLSGLISMGMTRYALDLLREKQPQVATVFSQIDLLPRYIGMMVLIGLAVVGGFILLIIPGLVLAVRYSFALYALVDEQCSATGAMAHSMRITKGHVLTLLGYGIIIVLLNIAGALCLGVGLLVTMPVTWISAAALYEQIGRPQSGPVPMNTQINGGGI
jgi:uncharacterized membrane protein